MSARRRITFLFALAAGCAAIAGCGADTPTEPRGKGSAAEIAGDVFVVDEKVGLSLVDANDTLLAYDVLGRTVVIPPGAVIVGTDRGGYIRRVRSVLADGNRLLVRTTPASLADAVLDGILDATTTIGFSGSGEAARGATDRGGLVAAARGVSVSDGGLNLSNIVLFAGDSGGVASSVTITSGRIEFAPAIDLSMRVADYKLHRFRVNAEGDLRIGCDARIEASGRIRNSRKAPIATVRKAAVRRFGSVPVVEVVTMSFVAGFDVSSDSAFASELGLEIAGPVQFGMQLERGVWSQTFTASPSFALRPFRYDGRENARIVLTIEPRITVEFFGLPCADLAFGPAFGLVERNEEGLPVLAWEVFASYDGAAKFDRGALDFRTAPYDSGPHRCFDATLAWGPFRTDSYIFARQWGNEATIGDGVFSYPKGIAVDAAGDVYVTDSWNNDVQKFTADGAFLLRWGGPGIGDGQFDSPEKIAVDEVGNVYVVDGGNSRVQKFSPGGSFILKWGSEGTGDGQFRFPVGVAASGGAVYVADGGNNRVQKFSTAGDFIGAWGEYGAGSGQFNGPMGVAASPADGSVLVADCQNHRIQRFSAEGAPLAAWGGYGQGDDRFDCAIDVTAAAGGAIFAADLGNDRFVQFTADGAFATKLGVRGTGEGQFDHPEGVAVDAGGNVYVVDARNRRVQKFAPRIR
jgi:DNA-binding beta-propeller fold protein YncE